MTERNEMPAEPKPELVTAIIDTREQILTSCDHTLHTVNADGQRPGSWIDEQVGTRWRVICPYCGRFYGHHTPDYQPT